MNLKILIPYHRKAPIWQDDFIIPIHVGRSLSMEPTKDGVIKNQDLFWLFKNMIGDDTGENISLLNRQLCENTALYWAWKNYHNTEITHIGFMQYRRLFIFNDELFEKSLPDIEKIAYGVKHFSSQEKNLLQKIHLNYESISQLLQENTVILPKPGNLKEVGVSSLWDDYVTRIPGVHIDDLILLLNVLYSKDKKAGKNLEIYLNGTNKLMYQMMILSKENFFNYCDFLFPLLFTLNEQIDTSMYSLNGQRTLGYLSELLFGLYFLFLAKDRGIKTIFKGVAFIDKV